MSEAKEEPKTHGGSPQRWLCSHLVRLAFVDSEEVPETVLLEEIDVNGAVLAVESYHPPGLRLTLRAGEFAAPAVTAECRVRENDFALEVCFTEGYQWSPTRWEPDHLYQLPTRKAKGKAAAGD